MSKKSKTSKTTAQCAIQNVSDCDFAVEKCGNCAKLGVWVGFGMDEDDMHLCNMLGAVVYANGDPCEDYEKAK